MKTTRLGRVGYIAAAATALWLAWFGYTSWRYYFGRVDFPKIDHPREAAQRPMRRFDVLPAFNIDQRRPLAVDLRGTDVSRADLRDAGSTLRDAVFDSATRWPGADKMPPSAEFDRERSFIGGRNPGLGVRQLHAEGITGRGVGIAFIDGVLFTGHPEYAERLRLYEETGDVYWPWNRVDGFPGTGLHGPAVVSIAAGRTTGVAPDADVYYIGTHGGLGFLRHFYARVHVMVTGGDRNRQPEFDYAVVGRALRRIVAVNQQLPTGRKIRVVSMSLGWNPKSKGYAEMHAAAHEAKAAGLFVVSSNLREIHGMHFQGLGRDARGDPDSFESYAPGSFWAEDFERELAARPLLVPMDSRTTAGFTADAEYVFYPLGGWSWATPYIAGVYALAVQVKPEITPDEFWATATKTARSVQYQHRGCAYELGPIIDPVALIRALRPTSGSALTALPGS